MGVCALTGVLGSVITYLFGGMTAGMQTLITLMIIDYGTGLMVAGVFRKSSKTETGGLNSYVGFKGLAKKFVELMIVAAMFRIDVMLDVNYLKDLSIIGFAFNELISITENAGLMGIPLPSAVSKSIELLNTQIDKKGGSK